MDAGATKSQDEAAIMLEERIVKYLKNEGLSPFSAKVALGFLQGQLQKEGGFERLKRVNLYLQAALNGSRTHVNHLQKGCPNIIPGLRAQPYWDATDLDAFPWIPELEAAFPAIKEEFMSLVGTAGLFQPYRSPAEGDATSGSSSSSSSSSDKVAADMLGKLATSSGDWNVCYLYLHGLNFDSNLEKLPITTAALGKIPRFYNHAFLSALVPGTTIIPHYGPTNKKLRCHLPLLVPGEGTSCLVVSGEERPLRAGKCTIFDDSFEHSSRNTGASSRVVLIFDVWHPDLQPEEVKFMGFINKAQIAAARKMKEQLQGEASDFLSVIERSRAQAKAEADGGAGNEPSASAGAEIASVWECDVTPDETSTKNY